MSDTISPQYTNQFPDLMRGKKIMYVHGFASSAQSGTVERLRRFFPTATVLAEDIPLAPQEALAMLKDMAAREQPSLIIGTSMGGMFAEMLHGFDRILVNPAFNMAETMKEHGMIGTQHFHNPRQDGASEFLVTKALVKEYQAATGECFRQVTPEEQGRVYGLFGDEDELVHTIGLFREHYPKAIPFHGGHRLDDHALLRAVIPVIRWIDDKQEQRERPVVFIGLECLMAANGEARASAQKAFRHLLRAYNVFVVAPAPEHAPERLAETLAWTAKYLDAPAWNHVIFTNQRQLLLGDYLIAPEPEENFMGAGIRHGSDALKTWEEIMVFFDRLGGQ